MVATEPNLSRYCIVYGIFNFSQAAHLSRGHLSTSAPASQLWPPVLLLSVCLLSNANLTVSQSESTSWRAFAACGWVCTWFTSLMLSAKLSSSSSSQRLQQELSECDKTINIHLSQLKSWTVTKQLLNSLIVFISCPQYEHPEPRNWN